MTKISIFKFSFTTALLIVPAVLLTGSQALAWSNASFNQNQTIPANALATGNSGAALSKSSSSLPTSTKINYDTSGKIKSYEIPLTSQGKETTLAIDASYNVRGERTSDQKTLLTQEEVNYIYSFAQSTLSNWPTNILLLPSKVAIRNYGMDTFNKSDYVVKAGDETLEMNLSSLLGNIDTQNKPMNTFLMLRGLAEYTWNTKENPDSSRTVQDSFITNWKQELDISDNAEAKNQFSLNIAQYFKSMNVLDYPRVQSLSKFFMVSGETNKVWTYTLDAGGTISAQKSALIIIENTDSEDDDNPDYGKRYNIPENMILRSGWEKQS